MLNKIFFASLFAITGFLIYAGFDFWFPRISLVKFLSDISNVIIAFFSVLLIVQIYQTEKWNKINIALSILPFSVIISHTEEYNEVAKKHGHITPELLNDDADLAAKKIWDNLDYHFVLMKYFARLNDFCLNIRTGVVDENFAKKLYYAAIVTTYQSYKFYFDYIKKEYNVEYLEFKNIAEKWDNKRKHIKNNTPQKKF